MLTLNYRGMKCGFSRFLPTFRGYLLVSKVFHYQFKKFPSSLVGLVVWNTIKADFKTQNKKATNLPARELLVLKLSGKRACMTTRVNPRAESAGKATKRRFISFFFFYPGLVQEKRSIRVVPYQWELTFKLTQFKVYIFHKRCLRGLKL